MGKLARTVGRLLGYDVMRLDKSFRFDATLSRLIANYDFDCVIDVGANVGGFSKYCLRAMPRTPVYSFEPAADLAEKLKRQAVTNDCWKIMPVALGDAPGQATLHTSSSKSVYNSLNASGGAFQSTSGITFDGQQTVEVSTLDLFFKNEAMDCYGNILLKIDTQGHDYKVLKGASNMLGQVKAVIVELPFQNIYETTDSYADIMDFLIQAGFSFYGVSPISTDSRGAIIEADGFFVRVA